MVSRIRFSSQSKGSPPVNGSIIIKIAIGNESPLTESKAEDIFGKKALLIRDNDRNVWTATVNWMFGESCWFQRGSAEGDSDCASTSQTQPTGSLTMDVSMKCGCDLNPRIGEWEQQGMLKQSKQTTSHCSELWIVVSQSPNGNLLRVRLFGSCGWWSGWFWTKHQTDWARECQA